MQYSEGMLFENRYHLKKAIGRGSFGEVWLALDTISEVEVAIKIYVVMDQHGLEEFKKEFQVSFELNHTNLLRANDLKIAQESNCPYLVMPFCPQGSVSSLLGKITEEQLWIVIRDVARGLDYLHRQDPPIVHQDIKPDNILISKTGDYVITDFGISRRVRDTVRKASAHLVSAGSVAYMAPERFEGTCESVKASDIWSLGASIYELVMGYMPFSSMGGGMLKNGADYPDLPMEFSKEIDQTMKACLAKEPWDRPTAEALADYATLIVKGKPADADWIKPEDVRIKPEPSLLVTEVDPKPPVRSFGSGVFDIPVGDVPVKTPKPRFKNKIILGTAAAVIVAIICVLVSMSISACNKEKEEQQRIEAIVSANNQVIDKVNQLLGYISEDISKGDNATENPEIYYLQAIESLQEIVQKLKEYNTEVGEPQLQIQPQVVVNRLTRKIDNVVSDLSAKIDEYEVVFSMDELADDETYHEAKERKQKCEEALHELATLFK